MTAPREDDDDSPDYSHLLNDSLLNDIFSQPEMSNLLSSEKQEQNRRGRLQKWLSSQGKCVIVCGVMLQLGIHSRQFHIATVVLGI